MKFFVPIILCLFLPFVKARSQAVSIDESGTAPFLSPIGGAFNRIFNGRNLDSFYIKLALLKKNKQGVIRIVHIGDSHIQAGYFPGYVREHFQQFFGDAGRGLVFPYQVIQTTSPEDINSNSNITWKSSRVAVNGGSAGAGISGYGIQTASTGSTIEMNITGSQVFRRLKFFIDKNMSSSWILRAGNNASSYVVKNSDDKKILCPEINLDSPANQFVLSSLPAPGPLSFFGVSLETDQPGVLYHAIGVNGARYEQYNASPLFWQQLPLLQADLFIISLGTNEAQKNSFDNSSFRKEVGQFIKKLKTASPRAAILITTAADSYKAGVPNGVLRLLNLSLFEYCTDQSIPVWDLYRITNGYGSAHNWFNRGMMNPDLVHFTGEGYRLQGQLLFNALAKGYNDYHGF